MATTPDATLIDRELLVASLDQVEDAIYELGGRFACAIIHDRVRRLYLDPCGTLAVVYAKDESVVGSTTSALSLNDPSYFARRQAEPGLPVNHFHIGGLTGDDRFARLLPNHYLDLDAWHPVRHWPLEMPKRGDDSTIPANVHTIVQHLSATIRAVAGRFVCYMGLTAGRDSRMVLAASRPVVDRFKFFTFRFKEGGYNAAKVVDIHVARKLSGRLGLDHRELGFEDTPQALRDEFRFRTGYAGFWGRVIDNYQAVSSFDMDGVFMTGFAGEVGRAFYWGWGDALKEELTAELLLKRMNLAVSAQNVDAMNRWLEGLPGRDYFALLDLLYIERRVGCWAAPDMYGYAPFAFVMTPFCHRRIIEAMMALPADYRVRQGMATDVARLAWPATTGLPFQQYTGLRGLKVRMTDRYRSLRKRLAKVFRVR